MIPWIDENIHPYTGDWISRTILRNASWPKEKGGEERGEDYNHSTFIDLLLSGLLGIRPRANKDLLDLNPLLPAKQVWPYFCVDQVRYHGRWVTIIWDETGEQYKQGKGLTVLVDGEKVANSLTLRRLRIFMRPL